jgi:hypothetical protein
MYLLDSRFRNFYRFRWTDNEERSIDYRKPNLRIFVSLYLNFGFIISWGSESNIHVNIGADVIQSKANYQINGKF